MQKTVCFVVFTHPQDPKAGDYITALLDNGYTVRTFSFVSWPGALAWWRGAGSPDIEAVRMTYHKSSDYR
jgi:hypothetical protein